MALALSPPPSVTTVAALDTHRYLYLVALGEPRDNVLRLELAEAQTPEAETPAASGYGPIVADGRSALYEVVFDHYVAYSVRNEGYTVEDAAEAFSGKVAGMYANSRFLDYVRHATIAASVEEAPYVHYGFKCLNHIVDVVAFGAPVVSRLRKSQY